MKVKWTLELNEQLRNLHERYSNSHTKWIMIAGEMGITPEAARQHWKWLRGKGVTNKVSTGKGTSKIEYTDDSIYVIQASPRIMSQQELMEAYGIDPKKWRVEKYIIRTSEGYRKDRQVSWHVVDSQVIQGDVEDSGKMLVVPLYHMELRLARKEKEIKASDAVESLIKDACRYAPAYPKLNYPTNNDGHLYEIAMPDIHFGRLTWHEETGDDFDIKIAKRVVRDALVKLLQYTGNFKIDKILLPIGNDFFNVNSKTNTTVRGTPQDEDTRWQKTFRAGRMLAVEMIDACAAIASTDVMLIPGNHDEEKIFYLGDALACWYHNCSNVYIDNRAKSRKYYSFGKVLLGFTHGDTITMKKLPNLMQFEEPHLWGDSLYREWHTGDKHHKMDYILEAEEQIGVVIRILRSLVPADAWTFRNGLIGAQRAAEGFLWHPKNGLIAQFNAGVDIKDYTEV